MSSSATLIVVSVLIRLAVAIPWPGPLPTQAGLMAMAGMSPRPTDAPGFEGIPQALRKRNVQYPPPDNWCGFIAGDYSDPLSCRTQYTCAISGGAVGCCPDTTGVCDALYTTCYNYGDTCGSACQLDISIRKCIDPATPYCGTFAFSGGTHLYNCQITRMSPTSVEFLNDYYITAISSSAFLSSPTVPASSISLSSASSSSSSSLSSYTPPPAITTPGDSSSSTTYTTHSSGITAAAIGGIAAGISLLAAVVAGLILFFCLRRRRRMRVAQSQAAARAAFPQSPQSPPIQQEQVYPKTVEGGSYHPVSQQEQQAPAPQYPAPQYGKPAPQYPADTAAFYSPPPASQPQAPRDTLPPNPNDRPFSTAPTEVDGYANSAYTSQGQGDHYPKPPLSPTTTEVDGQHVVSPLHTPAPTGPVYEAPPPSSSNTYDVPPPMSGGHGGAPVYEVGNTQPYQGPWEMGAHHQ